MTLSLDLSTSQAKIDRAGHWFPHECFQRRTWTRGSYLHDQRDVRPCSHDHESVRGAL